MAEENVIEEIHNLLDEYKRDTDTQVEALYKEQQRLNDTIEEKNKVIAQQFILITELRKLIASHKSDEASDIKIEAIKEEIRFLHKQPHCTITPQWSESIMTLRHIVGIITGKCPTMGVYKKRDDERFGGIPTDEEMVDWGV